MMKEKIKKIKKHFRDNKTAYIAGTTALGTGVLAGICVANKAEIFSAKQVAIGWNNSQTLEVFIEALGDPGNIIQDTTTGTIYASQGQAAKALGLSPSEISKHLNGRNSHVKGHVFNKLGKAVVAD